jgi:hypothetical protein
VGKIKRKALLLLSLSSTETPKICALCEREIPKPHIEAHHMTPKSKGGEETQLLHSVCHRQIHALLTETELAKHFNTIHALQQHPDVKKFVGWIKTKPLDFKERSRKSKRLKSLKK